jgi:ribosome-associated protein
VKKKAKARSRPTRLTIPIGLGSPLAAGPSAEAQRMALRAAEAGLDKKATDIGIIDVTGKVDYADFLVLMTGQSERHVASIAEGVDEALGKSGWNAILIEGLPRGHWVLIDFVDIVVHVFCSDTRSLYDIDGLWMDARRLRVPDSQTGSS